MVKQLLLYSGKGMITIAIVYFYMLLGYYTNNILISTLIILSITIMTKVSINMLNDSVSVTGINDNIVHLSYISWFLCYMFAFLFGAFFSTSNSYYVGSFVYTIYFYILGFSSATMFNRINKMKLIMTIIYIFIGFISIIF